MAYIGSALRLILPAEVQLTRCASRLAIVGSLVFATVVSERVPSAEAGHGDGGVPFNVEYSEKPHASGQIPMSPTRREFPNLEVCMCSPSLQPFLGFAPSLFST